MCVSVVRLQWLKTTTGSVSNLVCTCRLFVYTHPQRWAQHRTGAPAEAKRRRQSIGGEVESPILSFHHHTHVHVLSLRVQRRVPSVYPRPVSGVACPRRVLRTARGLRRFENEYTEGRGVVAWRTHNSSSADLPIESSGAPLGLQRE